jgi:2-polyprenyl-6-methoxyphenol hydroxylase-like FAD-dependent oxidoreductase
MITNPPRTEVLDVLIVGAGPTGLVLALWLKRRGVRVRIIDKTAEPGTTSRALVVHARTLELYRQLGIAAEVVERGLKFTAVNLWVRGKRAARAELGDLGRGLTPFPELLIFPQDQHERLLIEHLRRAGVSVERRTELVGFESHGDRVVARTMHAGCTESVGEVAYLVGCDGAHSKVRELLGIGFPGGTYERVFYVADVEMRGPASTPELHLALDDADFLAVFPMKGDGVGRIIGTIAPQAERRRDLSHDLSRDLSWDDVSAHAIEHMRLEVARINWFSTYRVHHRVAESFRRGRVFLAGDAAHVHSPVGGQGMNTGIGDAVNLAWKLADVLGGRASAELLASYEPERIAFARRLVATTDRAFTLVSRDGWLARAIRMGLAPRLLPGLVQRPAVRRFMFRTISQTAITYRGSAVSRGKAGAVHGGDRLPWIAASDNFAPLVSLDWQIHVYGQAGAGLRASADLHGVPLHVFAWGPDAQRAGVRQDAAYLVRPDGYVALADPSASAREVSAYLDARRPT